MVPARPVARYASGVDKASCMHNDVLFALRGHGSQKWLQFSGTGCVSLHATDFTRKEKVVA